MELILPKAADVKLTFGFPKTTRFSGFCISTRNWCVKRSPILVCLKTAKLSSRRIGPRTSSARGELP